LQGNTYNKKGNYPFTLSKNNENQLILFIFENALGGIIYGTLDG